MKPEDIPQDFLGHAVAALGVPGDDNGWHQSQDVFVVIARAIMAAEKRGEEAAQAKMAALLKDPAAVRVNYLRGDIACHDLIREGEEREREAILDAASSYLKDQYGYGMLSHPVDRARIAAIRNRGKP